MQWKWQTGERTYRALRAVDTATHPDYRRRGIFKRLTGELVAHCREKGYDFIFNNPNEQSRQGYLKMGWKEWTTPPLYIQWIRPLHMIRSVLRTSGRQPTFAASISPEHRLTGEALEQWAGWNEIRPSNEVYTPFTRAYVRWRYLNCPIYTYGLQMHSESFLVFRIQHSRFGPLMKVCDWKWTERATADLLQREWKRMLAPYFVHAATLPRYRGDRARSFRRKNWMWHNRSINPGILYRTLGMKTDRLPPAGEWDFSSGVLELF